MPIRNDGAGQRDERLALFVEKSTYRRRRLMDIARLAPILGALLLAVPLLWPDPPAMGADPSVSVQVFQTDQTRPGGAETAAATGVSTSWAMIYVFSIWGGLVIFAAAFSFAVRQWAVHWTHRSDPEALVGPVGQTSALTGGAAQAELRKEPQDPSDRRGRTL